MRTGKTGKIFQKPGSFASGASFLPRLSGGLLNSSQKQKLWLFGMKLGERMGCHQKPERSFFIKGFQFPVCARCTGVLTGYLLFLGMFSKKQNKGKLALAGCLCMLADWVIQALKIRESTNRRRFVTGAAGGMGLMYFQVQIWKKIGHFKKGRK